MLWSCRDSSYLFSLSWKIATLDTGKTLHLFENKHKLAKEVQISEKCTLITKYFFCLFLLYNFVPLNPFSSLEIPTYWVFNYNLHKIIIFILRLITWLQTCLLPTADNILSRPEPSKQTFLTLRSYPKIILVGVVFLHFEKHKYTVTVHSNVHISLVIYQNMQSVVYYTTGKSCFWYHQRWLWKF